MKLIQQELPCVKLLPTRLMTLNMFLQQKLSRPVLTVFVLLGLSSCGVTGADPTGTAAMVQVGAHRQKSVEMQRQATSSEAADEREANMKSAIAFCRQHPEVEGCAEAVRDEVKTMETMRKMRAIGH